MSLNFAADWDITLGNDEMSLKPIIESFDVKQPKASINTPLIWTGQLDITRVEWSAFPVEMDARVNPSRWRRRQPLRLYLLDELFLVLYLKRYFFDYNPRTLSGESNGDGFIEVECRLGANSGERPIKRPLSFFEQFEANRASLLSGAYQRVVPWTQEVRRTLVEGTSDRASLKFTTGQVVISGIPTTLQRTLTGVGVPQTDGFSAEPQEVNSDPIQDAQDKAGARGYWVWMNSSNQVRLTPYPRSFTPVLRFARNEIDKFELQEPGEQVQPNTIKVVGRGVVGNPLELPQSPDPNLGDRLSPPNAETPLPSCDTTYPFEAVVKDDFGRIIELTRTYRPAVSSNTVFRRTTKLISADLLFGSGGGGLITARDEQQEEYYDNEGKPLRKTTIVLEPLGVLDPINYPNNGGLIRSETITELWSYNAFGQPISRSSTTRSPGFVVFGDSAAGSFPVFAEGETETWSAVGCGKYRRTLNKFVPKGLLRPDPETPFDDSPLLVPESTEEEDLNSLPEPPYKEVEQEEEVKEFVESYDVSPDDLEPDSGNAEETREIPHINSQEAAKEAAELLVRMAQHTRYSRTITRPIDLWTVQNYQPFQVEDIDNGRFIRDGFAVWYSGGEIGFAYTGLEVGVLNPPVTKPVKRAVVRTATLTVVSEPDYSFAVGVAIAPITLNATGGTPPYLWSASGLPTGLSLSSGVISGTPTIIASNTVTVTVTDSTSATANDSFALNITAIPSAKPHYTEVTRVSAICEHTFNSSLEFAVPPIVTNAIAEHVVKSNALLTQFFTEHVVKTRLPIQTSAIAEHLIRSRVVESGLGLNLAVAYLFNNNLEDAVGSLDLSVGAGTESYVSGQINQAVAFDGSTYLSRASAAALEMGTTPYTIALVFEYAGSGNLVGKWSDFSDVEYAVSLDSNDGIVLVSFKIGGTAITKTLPMPGDFDYLGKKYLLVCWNSITANEQGIALRLIETGSTEETFASSALTRASGSADFKVGGDNSYLPGGWIDALYIWRDRILTTGERASLYTFTTDLVEYPFTPTP